MKLTFLQICFLLLLFLPLQSNGSEMQYIKYPGNGIPFFSKDKPVKELNEKISSFFEGKEFFNIANEKISFKNTKSDFTLNTNLAITNENLTIKYAFNLTQGKITIEIGNIKYQITPQQAIVLENEKIVHKLSHLPVMGIMFNRGYSMGNKISSTAYITTDGGNSGENVNIKLPALINITVHQGSTGTLDKWHWVRGSK